jgi:ABC-2 type transport system permease protein
MDMTAALRDAVFAEWTKLRSISSNTWLLLAAIAVTVATSGLATSVEKCPAGCTTDPAKLSLTGIQLGQAIVVIVAVMLVSGEYSNGTIRFSLAAVPQRSVMLAAKSTVISVVVAVVSAVAVLGSVLAGQIFLPGNGFTAANGAAPLSLGSGLMLRAAGGSVLYLVLIALLSIGLATALRDSALTITVVLGLLYIFPIIGYVLPNHAWQDRIERFAPMSAGLAIQSTKDLSTLPIGPWAGLGVLAGWTAAALVIGWLLLLWRDA